MARPLQHSFSFAHPVDRVLDAIATEASLRQRLAAVGGQGAELVSYRATGSGAFPSTGPETTYGLKQVIAAEDLPGIVQQVRSGDLIVNREQTWTPQPDGTVTGTGRAEVSGVPAKITVRSRLTPDGDGTNLQVTGEVKVSIPLLGGKLESVIGQQVERLLRHEDAYVARQLDGTG